MVISTLNEVRSPRNFQPSKYFSYLERTNLFARRGAASGPNTSHFDLPTTTVKTQRRTIRGVHDRPRTVLLQNKVTLLLVFDRVVGGDHLGLTVDSGWLWWHVPGLLQ